MRPMHKQKGVVLLIGMMMLILLTLMAVAALKFGTSNFALVNNQQTRGEAIRSAEQVIDQLINNQEIALANNANLFNTTYTCNGVALAANQIPIGIVSATACDYRVVVNTPVCIKRLPIKQASLNFAVADDLGCSKSVDQASLGVEGAAAGDSLCSEVTWDVSATANDAFQQNNVTVTQGVGQRVASTKVNAVCD